MRMYTEPPSTSAQPECPRLGLFAWADYSPQTPDDVKVVEAIVTEMCRMSEMGVTLYPVSVKEAHV